MGSMTNPQEITALLRALADRPVPVAVQRPPPQRPAGRGVRMIPAPPPPPAPMHIPSPAEALAIAEQAYWAQSTNRMKGNGTWQRKS